MKLFVSLALIGVGSAAFASSISFTFDNDNEGWTKGNFGSSFGFINTNSNGPATWGAPGQLNGTDHSDYAFQFSPDLGGGHGDLFGGTISLDFLSQNPTAGEDPFLVLMSSDHFLIKEYTVISNGAYSTYTFDLSTGQEPWYFDSSDYYQASGAVLATNADVQSVLDDLRYIGVSTDIASGTDATMTDNVNLSPVPEPATLALFVFAPWALRRRKH